MFTTRENFWMTTGAALALLVPLTFVGCSDDGTNNDSIGERIEDAADDTKDAMEDGWDKTKDMADDAGDAIEDAADDTKDAFEDMGDEIEDAADDVKDELD